MTGALVDADWVAEHGQDPGVRLVEIDWDGLDAYHLQAVTERQDLPTAQLYGDFKAAHIRFKSLVRNFPDDKLDRKFVFPWGAIGNLETLVTSLGHHEESHCFDLIESTRSG